MSKKFQAPVFNLNFKISRNYKWIVSSLLLFTSPFFAFAVKSNLKGQKKMMQQHQAQISNSQINQSAYVGLDTLFCSGKPVAIAHELVSINNSKRLQLKSFSDQQNAIIIDSLSNEQKQVVYQYQFPTLGMLCSAVKKSTWITSASAVCKYQLMTNYGIDTTKAEMFLTLNGASAKQIPLKVDSSQVPYEKRYIVKRDLKAPLTYSEDQVAQDGQLIAKWEENIVKSPQGDLLQLSIMNALGAEIATASRGKLLNANNTYTWHILTHKDLKFHSTELQSEGELGELIKFLIQKQYL